MNTIFDAGYPDEIEKRLSQLHENTGPLWGKMNASQMLAHCNVSYNMVYDTTQPKPGFLKRLLLQIFVKKVVVSATPFKRNSPTGPEFIIKDSRDFETEKQLLLANIQKTQHYGSDYFQGKSHINFGTLTLEEWHTLFHKHLDHHLSQFGV